MIGIPDSVKESIILNLYNKFRASRTLIKTAFVISILLIFFIFSRLNYLGEGLHRVSTNLIPINIPIIDPAPIKLKVFSSFEHLKNDKSMPIINGGNYTEGDIFSIKYTTNADAWILILNIDSKGIHPIYPSKLEAIKYQPLDKNTFEVLNFSLDNQKGREFYYIFASEEKFSFEKDIKSYLEEAYKQKDTSKGAVLIDHLNLPEKIYHHGVGFFHI